MFKRTPTAEMQNDPDAFTFDFEGKPVWARAGDTIAAALLAAGVVDFRTTPVSGSCRGPWCMMGICFECLVEVDGVPNRQACQIVAKAGMHVARQHGARRLAV